MSYKSTLKPLAIAASAAFVSSLASTTIVNAAENPFAMSELSSGYMVAGMAEGKCGAGKNMDKEGKCGEGKCGMSKMDADGDGNVTRGEFMSGHESMFGKMDANGDGMLDASEQNAGMKAMKEGKCGEGKCGGDKAAGKARSMKEGQCGGSMKMDTEGKCGGNKMMEHGAGEGAE